MESAQLKSLAFIIQLYEYHGFAKRGNGRKHIISLEIGKYMVGLCVAFHTCSSVVAYFLLIHIKRINIFVTILYEPIFCIMCIVIITYMIGGGCLIQRQMLETCVLLESAVVNSKCDRMTLPDHFFILDKKYQRYFNNN